MLPKLFYIGLRSLFLMTICFIQGCNSGEISGGTTPVSAGYLGINNVDNKVAIGGTNHYTTNLIGSSNLPKPVQLKIKISDSSIATIESNNCTTSLLYSNDSSKLSCSFFVKGYSEGVAHITISADG
jgi:hypothetical protein